CREAQVSPPQRQGFPESCGKDPLGKPQLTALVGRPRLLLVGPTGAAGEARDCRGGTQELVGRLTTASGSATAATYEADVTIPGQLGAARTDWVVVPPLLVSSDGVVTRHSYQPALAGDRYRSATSGGQVGTSKAM